MMAVSLNALAVMEIRYIKSKQNHNKVDPQGPTKTDLPAPVFFRRRVSLPNHFYLPCFPYPPYYLPFHPWSALYQMAGPSRSTPAAGSSRHEEYKVQPPRPANAWILYRSYQFSEIRKHNTERLSQAEVSKRIAYMWKHETEEVKRGFEQLAEAEKLKHQQLYPDYRFCPQKKEDKLRSKEEIKQNRRAKKSKARDATPPDADATATATPPMPHPPPMPQPYFIPSYPPNMVLPQPYMLPYPPEAHYGPGGPSPPISAAPSPAPYEGSQSPCSDGNVASSSSTPIVRPSTSSDPHASSTSLQLPPNQFYVPSLPSSHQPSPNAYATQSLPTVLFQSSPPSELPLNSHQSQPPSPENTVVPAATVWNNIHTQLPDLESQNSEVSFRGVDRIVSE